MVRLARMRSQWSGSLPSNTVTASVAAIDARNAGYSRAIRDTAKARRVCVRSSVMKMTKPLMMKNSSTPRLP